MFEKVRSLPWLSYPISVLDGTKLVSDSALHTGALFLLSDFSAGPGLNVLLGVSVTPGV